METPSEKSAGGRRPRLSKAGRIAAVYAGVFAAAAVMIAFGWRNDAVSVSESIKNGVLNADSINVAFENVGGRLVERPVTESQEVRKGDVLMVLDGTDNAISIERTKAQVAAAEASVASEEEAIRLSEHTINLDEGSQWKHIEELHAQVVSAQKELDSARADVARYGALVKSGAIPKKTYDDAVTKASTDAAAVTAAQRQLDSATLGATKVELQRLNKEGKAYGMHLYSVRNSRRELANRRNTLARLEANLDELKASLKQLEVDRGRLTLRAPEDGKVLKFMYEPGEMVAAGTPAVLLETKRRYIDIYVSEKIAAKIRPGQRIKASIPALGKDAEGTVRYVEAASSFADLRATRERGQADLTSFDVRIYLDDVPGILAGMSVEVKDEGGI
jgi:HlyD family secretion protein